MAEEPEPELVAELYPNPSRPNENLKLHLTGTAETVNVRVVDMMGKSYYNSTISAQDYANGVDIIPSEHLGKGMYILMIQQGSKTRKQTLIVRD